MKKGLYTVFALFLLAALIAAPAVVQNGARDALLLCAQTVIPSLFPFFVLSVLLNRLGLPELMGKVFGKAAASLFGVSGEGVSALFIGLTGGYPMGAAYIADMCVEGRIGTDEAERLLCFCNNSGPAFILGAVGAGAFGSRAAGLMLYAVHIAAAILTGIFFSAKTPVPPSSPKTHGSGTDPETAFPDAVKAAVSAVLNVCGFVVFFSVLLGVLDSGSYLSRICLALGSSSGLGADYIRALITGLFELGNGVGALRYLSPTPQSMALAAFLLGFGSLSVQCQTAAVIARAKLNGARHFVGRLVMAVISAILAYVCGIAFFS